MLEHMTTDEFGFGFNENQEFFRWEVRKFAQRELAPGALERSRLDRVPKDILAKIAEMGILGLNIPEEYGGVPSDYISNGIAVEEMAKVDFAAGVLGLEPAASAAFILKGGSEELKREWVPRMTRGEILCCLAITEPGAGSDAASIKTRAVREGDHYILNGEKTAITKGMQSEIALVFAKTDPDAGAKGVSCFLVPMNSPGVQRSSFKDMGWHLLNRASLSLDGVRIPVKNRLGKEGEGFYMVMGQFDVLRILFGLAGLGMAQGSLQQTIEYSKIRNAFGRPIAKFEGVSFKLVEDAAYIEAARLLCYRALWLHDRGIKHTKESAMCKWWCPQIAVNVIHDCLLTHGHIGYSEDHPLEGRLRDAVGLELADGPADIMKMIISRALFKEFPAF